MEFAWKLLQERITTSIHLNVNWQKVEVENTRAGYVFLLSPSRRCPLRAACYPTIIKTLAAVKNRPRAKSLPWLQSSALYSEDRSAIAICNNKLPLCRPGNYRFRSRTPDHIDYISPREHPAAPAGSTQAGQLRYPWRQDSSGPTSARNGKPASAQACQLLPVAIRTAWEFIMLVTSSASCIHTSLLPE